MATNDQTASKTSAIEAASNESNDDVVTLTNAQGVGGFIIVCEHASNFVPPELCDLGLSGELLQSHIAWDLGALPVAAAMAELLDAPLVASRISRLVYDCNRSSAAKSAVPESSEIYRIPGNANVSALDRQARENCYYAPFRDALAGVINRRAAGDGAPVLITIHSFAPIYNGVTRSLDIGVIHDADARLADEFLRLAQAEARFRVMRNAPYGPPDGVTHTLAEHALPHGLLNVMIEIRNDLISSEASQRDMAAMLANLARRAAAALSAFKPGKLEPA